MIDYNKEFDKVTKDLEEKFGAYLLFVLGSDTIRGSIDLGEDTFIALYLLSKAKSAINKKIEELINLGEVHAKENEK